MEQAFRQLAGHKACKVVRKSSIYETEPWGLEDQPQYLNQVIEVQTSLAPRNLLMLCHQIESDLNRQRQQAWGPRTLDIDILLYASVLIEDSDFHVPHKHLHERRFALVPLVELAPDVMIPGKGMTAEQLLLQCPDTRHVQILN